jgi:hypothetical protein
MVDGKNFRLADEVRYILRRAAEHDGRVVTIGQLVLFSTETGDAWLLDPSDQLAARWPAMETPNHSTLKKTRPPSRLTGRGPTASREPHSFTGIEKPDGSPPSTDIRRTN